MQPFNSITTKDLQFLKSTRVFIVGDIILDSYIEGKVSRISPEAPVPVILESNKRYVAGGASNVATNIANIGAYAELCGRVGNDAEAKILKETLEKIGVNTQSLITEDHIPTTTKTRIVSHHEYSINAHQLVRIDRESLEPINQISKDKCIKSYKDFISKGGQSALVISDYGKGVLSPDLIQNLIQISLEHNIPVITDPKHNDVIRYKNSTIIKPNLSEGRNLYRATKTNKDSFSSLEDEVYHVAKNYLELSGCHNIVMSLSQHGVLTMGKNIKTQEQNDYPMLRFETKALQVADVSGAGDTLIAFLAMSLAAKLSIEVATELGNLAAGIVCGKMGTSLVHMDELFEKIHPRQSSSSEKILTIKDLTPIIEDLKAKNKKIVFTNGCFDILHAGHVDYLQKSKQLGHFLIVALNSDASVKRLKGETRPVQTFEDRAQILAALSCVDFIVKFEEDTPLNTILALKPNCLVKGADYNLSNTVGAKEVLSWGGTVEHIDLVPGRSTTSILRSL